MAEGLRKPEPVNFENAADSWRRFVQDYEIYIAATGFADKDPKVQAMILLNLAGQEAIEKERSFTYTAEETRFDPDVLKRANLKQSAAHKRTS